MIKHKYLAIFFTILVILLDQITKEFSLNLVSSNNFNPIKITPFLNIGLSWNNGISFGMFDKYHYSRYIFSILSIIVSIILFIWMNKSKDKIETYSLALIIGGAIGNTIDRVKFGAVIDFIDFFIYSYHWYLFNIADSAIFLGVMALLFLNIIRDHKR